MTPTQKGTSKTLRTHLFHSRALHARLCCRLLLLLLLLLRPAPACPSAPATPPAPPPPPRALPCSVHPCGVPVALHSLQGLVLRCARQRSRLMRHGRAMEADVMAVAAIHATIRSVSLSVAAACMSGNGDEVRDDDGRMQETGDGEVL